MTLRTILVSRGVILGAVAVWWLFFAILSAFSAHWFVLALVGFPLVTLVPGALLVAALPLRGVEPAPRFALVVAISIMTAFVSALIANTILPYLGIQHPLSRPVVFSAVSIGILLHATIFAQRVSHVSFAVRRYVAFDTRREIIVAAAPIAFVVLAVVGALRLNNGSGGETTALMLALCAAYLSMVAIGSIRRQTLGGSAIAYGLYFVSLALLLMTSLRGSYITGHDVQVEYFVFQITKAAELWSMDVYRDAYNACMSITILPTVFAQLFRLPDAFVYKVLFQLVFATVPGVIFAIARRYLSEVAALMCAIYFIAFPTFFADMPMLNRQEIAFLFWSLMIYIAFEDRVRLPVRHSIFLFLGLGVVLSHYSTTYTVIGILACVVLSRPLVRMLFSRVRHLRLFRASMIEGLGERAEAHGERSITAWMAVALLVASFLWSSVLTDTSSGSIARVVRETLVVMRDRAGEETRSSDVLYSLFSWGRPKIDSSFQGYERAVVAPRRAADPQAYYADDTYEARPITLPVVMPTRLGALLQERGWDVANINYVIRQAAAKILQVLMFIGVLAIILSGRYSRRAWDLDFVLLCAGSVLMIVALVALPVLSAEYGLLRAFQQSLMLIGPLVVIGSLTLFGYFRSRVRYLLAAVLSVVFFAAMTGTVAQLILRDVPQLHMSDTGVYYDIYYVHASEMAAVEWIARESPRWGSGAKVQTDRAQYSDLRRIPGIEVVPGMHPGLIRRDAFVLLGYTATRKEQSYVVPENGDVIMYAYPVYFLDEHKDLIYDNRSARIYR